MRLPAVPRAAPKKPQWRVVHHLDDAVAALRNAPTGQTLALISAPDAAQYAGLLYLRQMMKQAAVAAPHAQYVFSIDCGNDASLVIAALKNGFRHITCRLQGETLSKLREVAKAHDAVIDLLG